jgi:hypothetical protein
MQPDESQLTFRRTISPQYQGRRISEAVNQYGSGSKGLLTFNGLHGVIYQTIELFETTAVITSNAIENNLPECVL